MTAEFIHNGKKHQFDVSDTSPPAFIVYSGRACPKSPVLRFNLCFARMDYERRVAVYDVLAFKSE
jgi:hypothetical protein